MINCSSDLKNFENSRPSTSNFKSFSQSLEQFLLTVGQNKFGNKIPFIKLITYVLTNYELSEQNKDFPFLYLGHINDHLIMQYVCCIQLSTYYAILYFKRQVFFFYGHVELGKGFKGFINMPTSRLKRSVSLVL